jgi:hypothetical protein
MDAWLDDSDLGTDGGAVRELGGRDAYVERVTHLMDAEQDAEPDETVERHDALSGRAAWLSRLSHVCEQSASRFTDAVEYRRLLRKEPIL